MTQDELRPTSDELTVGEVSSRSGLAVSAIHFYENKGLITSRRSSGNQRRYRREVLRRIAIIRAAQRVGIPLKTIKAALDELPNNRVPNQTDCQHFSRGWHAELEVRIALLTKLKDQVGNCIGCGCLSAKSCPLFNPKDKVGKLGPGAHFLRA
jgi:MerR family redox-sensitive transcriptional activator SoxR